MMKAKIGKIAAEEKYSTVEKLTTQSLNHKCLIILEKILKVIKNLQVN
jgi:hypothetical protein